MTIPLARGTDALHKQIYAGLRSAVLYGKLTPGSRLPSTRDLAEQLEVSRSVALEAYDQLLAEGPPDQCRWGSCHARGPVCGQLSLRNFCRPRDSAGTNGFGVTAPQARRYCSHCGSHEAHHLEEAIAVLTVKLSDAEIKALEEPYVTP